ncbi:MAG: hypothetical protein HKN87_09420, partial [Saprospiraceae bacterium]|nr:hypothetical protein [Saprospiraceae bacterium]
LGVEIPKSDGGVRQLGIPTVVDRMIQQAIHQVLSRVWEPMFSGYSYGFRPGRNAAQALTKATDYIIRWCERAEVANSGYLTLLDSHPFTTSYSCISV